MGQVDGHLAALSPATTGHNPTKEIPENTREAREPASVNVPPRGALPARVHQYRTADSSPHARPSSRFGVCGGIEAVRNVCRKGWLFRRALSSAYKL